MPFDHSTFDPNREGQMLVESGLQQLNAEEMYPERGLCSRTPVKAKTGIIPRMPLAYAYGRTDRSAKVAEGDRAQIFNTHTDNIQYTVERAAAAADITHISRAELETMLPGGPLNFQAMVAQRQVLTEYAQDWNVIVSGAGSAGDDTLIDVVALPGGDEFDAASPSKTPEQYIREAVQFTKGSAMAVDELVLWALLANPNLAENDLNQRSMTEDEFRSWLAARGVNRLIVLKGEGQDQDPRQGYSTSRLHDGVCVIGKLEAIQYVVFNDLGNYTVFEEMSKTDYFISDGDYAFRVGYEQSLRCFTNTLS